MLVLQDPQKRHQLDRKQVAEVICALCDTQQPVSASCSSCGVTFGRYSCMQVGSKLQVGTLQLGSWFAWVSAYCAVEISHGLYHVQSELLAAAVGVTQVSPSVNPMYVCHMPWFIRYTAVEHRQFLQTRHDTVCLCMQCNFFDDDTTKQQFHCNDCGICRVGGRANFFHCSTCNCCYSITLQDSHVCVTNSMHQNCPVCFEYLFDSIRPIAVLACGHTIHQVGVS